MMHLSSITFVLQLLLIYFLSDANAARCPVNFRPPDGKCLIGCIFDSDCAPEEICCTSGCWNSCERLTKCQLERRRIQSRAGFPFYVPKCDNKGDYREIQCGQKRGQTKCWRVDKKHGRKVPNSEISVNVRQPQIPTTTHVLDVHSIGEKAPEEEKDPSVVHLKGNSKCFKRRKRRLKLRKKYIGVFVPQCKHNGKFKRTQCNESSKKCWCVNQITGKKVRGTEVRNEKPNCRQESCGRKIHRKRRIVGGQVSEEGAWPWQAALFLNGTQHRCGGALIKPSWILTAAHCFKSFKETNPALPSSRPNEKAGSFSSTNPSDWTVRLGEHSFLRYEHSEKHLRVLDIVIHPKYTPANLSHPGDYDIALVRISRSVKLGRYFNTICLPENLNYFKPGRRCVIVGWGKTSWNGSSSPVLREAWIDLVANRVCNAKGSYAGKISKRFICAGFKEGGTDACAYDSGGPLMCPLVGGRWVLAGIVSWGEKCALPLKYGVYSNVHEFLPWISRKLRTDR